MAIYVSYIDFSNNSPKEEFICIRKLGTSKTAEALMEELEETFQEKHISKENTRFSGLDGTNAMSGKQKGLQRRIRHISPYAIYLNCRNHRLALCLVHLMKQYHDLAAIDILLLALWKLFYYSSIKQAVFENAQIVEEMTPLKILKACTTRWLTHGETSIRVINRYKPLIAALDTIFHEKKDPEAKGIRDQLLSPDMILILLLLAELLVPVNRFCKFLQTRNLNYGLVMAKFKQVISKLEQIKICLPHHDAVDTKLKYFKLANEYLTFAAKSTDLGRSTRSNSSSNELSTEEKINKFIEKVGQPLTQGLIEEITGAMEETSPVLAGFDLFNPDCFDKSTIAYIRALTPFMDE